MEAGDKNKLFPFPSSFIHRRDRVRVRVRNIFRSAPFPKIHCVFNRKRAFHFPKFVLNRYNFLLLSILAQVLSGKPIYAQINHPSFTTACSVCGTMNRAFKGGETLRYKLYYHWHFLWLEAGEASVSVADRNFFGVPAYFISAVGRTLAKYDWLYKVRDTITTYIDTLNFTSLRFYRSTHENDLDVRNDNVFNNKTHLVYYLEEGKRYHRDSVPIQPSTIDMLTGVYLTRCINFNGIGAKNGIPLKVYLDGKVYNIHLFYLGKEIVSTSFGRFRCEKLSVDLIPGTIFREGASMKVWATDDANHMPVLVEAPIIIGSVRAEIESFSHLRNTMNAKVK